jgi:hypothetical protein
MFPFPGSFQYGITGFEEKLSGFIFAAFSQDVVKSHG